MAEFSDILRIKKQLTLNYQNEINIQLFDIAMKKKPMRLNGA